MMSADSKQVGVVGAGVMGFDIAFLYAMKGHPTLVYGASKALVEAARKLNEMLPAAPLRIPRLLKAMCQAGETFYSNGVVNPWLCSLTGRRSSHARL